MNHFGSVVAAYMVFWGLLMFYEFTISTRVSRLRRQVDRLQELLDQAGPK